MQPFVDPARKLRTALSTCSPTHPSLDYFIRLAFRLADDENGHRDYRNTDPQTRQTSLHLAALRGRIDVFEWLLEEGVDEGEVSRDVLGDTVLHIAAAKGYTDMAELYLSRYPFVVEWVNSRGMSPLHVAAKEGHLEVAQIFLDAGADIDAPDLEGNTPLHYASAWGKVHLLRLLVNLDCQTDWRNNEGFTAAEFAFSFGVLKELEAVRLRISGMLFTDNTDSTDLDAIQSIKQHAEDIRDARRQARKERRSKRANSSTLQAKRLGLDSSLSIAVPSPDPDADSPVFTVGLGLAQQTSSDFASANNHGGVPHLGAAVPPTPHSTSPRYPHEMYRDPRPPLRETADSPPATPSTPHFLYPNTTSPQPSPSASLGSSTAGTFVPVVASATGFPDARAPLRSVSTHSSLSNIAATAPPPPEALTFRPASRKHSSSFGAASAALAQEPRRREMSAPANSLAPPVTAAAIPGLSPPAESLAIAELPSDWPPNAEQASPQPSQPQPVAHNKLVKKSRVVSSGGAPAMPSSPPRNAVAARSVPGSVVHPGLGEVPTAARQPVPVNDPASAYEFDPRPQEDPPSAVPEPRLVYQPLPDPPASYAARNTGPTQRSFSGPPLSAVPANQFPRASFETDASARTSAAGSSVIIGPDPISRQAPPPPPPLAHDPQRVSSLAHLQHEHHPLPGADARSSFSLPQQGAPAVANAHGGARTGREHHKLKKHRRVSTDLARTTSVSTANGSERGEKSGGRLARAFGFGKKA
ncbi:hypothetical protein JCM10908_006566 [Rhodotorula pacifica]|uniref:uncharacterized protein n=1 Tax=Rhodotorula pacifica TaxID=1495444 RepID=UPI0031764E56